MSQLERQQQILRLLEAHPSLTVREISGTLFYSESSVRRDVRELEARGLVTHRWGGVMLTSDSTGVVPVTLREEENSAVKERLARDAAARARDGDTLLLDSSSTVRRMLPYLAERRDLRLITNNRRVFEMDLPKSFRLFCTGGAYHPENHNFYGPAAEDYLRSVRVDLLFFSSQGLSADGEISDASEEETALRRVMLTRAQKRIFLCDSSKLGVSRQFVLCSLDAVDEILCDAPERVEAIRARAQVLGKGIPRAGL